MSSFLVVFFPLFFLIELKRSWTMCIFRCKTTRFPQPLQGGGHTEVLLGRPQQSEAALDRGAARNSLSEFSFLATTG